MGNPFDNMVKKKLGMNTSDIFVHDGYQSRTTGANLIFIAHNGLIDTICNMNYCRL